MFCTFQQHCCCVTPGEALCACVCVGVHVCVCVYMCVASILLGRRVAPCCDCVYSFVTLWAALLSALNWHCHRMEGRKERAETVMTVSLPLHFYLLLLVKRGHFLLIHVWVQANIATQILDWTCSSRSRTDIRRPGSIDCSVREYHSHGLLPARAVLRSAKISWTPLQQDLGLLLPSTPQGTPCRTVDCIYFRAGCGLSDSV